MIYTELTKKAILIAYKAHKDQLDKSGMPYILHPFHLAEQMKDEKTTIIALLHDTIEDTDVTFDDLLKEGFGEDIIASLKLLTHEKSVPYMEYVKKIKSDKDATEVKKADLKHNSDLSRLSTITEKDLQRVEKYKKALEILEN